MASSLLIEIWKEKKTGKQYFQLFFHDSKDLHKLKLPGCNSEICELEKLTEIFQNLVPTQYHIECNNNNKNS